MIAIMLHIIVVLSALEQTSNMDQYINPNTTDYQRSPLNQTRYIQKHTTRPLPTLSNMPEQHNIQVPSFN